MKKRKGQKNSEASQEDSPYISKNELDDAISKIKVRKALGEDEITGEMVKYSQEEDKQELLSLLNLIARKKETPKNYFQERR
ncbi:hypothetical protein ILUMI_17514 [Ignelater luminosus]|uniref:Uncharacterized protein n=1 Tax=Ignelater luminosus TaxID=2038154 RepID=A0A8K0G779_IGNLU|nr:hypothetical protein ILUMI_17514 [Ignelater luminosus]